jgi:hypothetical protein
MMSSPQKAFNILQKHLDLHEMIELTALISHHLEVESQKLMIYAVELTNNSNEEEETV